MEHSAKGGQRLNRYWISGTLPSTLALYAAAAGLSPSTALSIRDRCLRPLVVCGTDGHQYTSMTLRGLHPDAARVAASVVTTLTGRRR